MPIPGNYKVRESRLLVAEDGTAKLELTMYAYPKPYTAAFELVPVLSKKELLESAIRRTCIGYLRLKFEPSVVEAFIEFTDTEEGGWLRYVAVNAQTGERELQREDLFQDVVKFLDEES